MISFDVEKGKFNYRIAGLIIIDQKVLLHKFENFDFWVLPGGRAEILENSKETILREMYEEIGEDVVVKRLLWLCENFFHHMNKDYHELSLYYELELKDDSAYLDFDKEYNVKEIDGTVLTYKWFDLKDVKDLNLNPSFIKSKIMDLNKEIEHIIVNELN